MEGRPADRLPMDFAGTSLTAAAPEYFEKLARTLGIPAGDHDQTVEAVLQALQVDFRHIGCIFEPETPYVRGKHRCNGTYQYTDCFGVTRQWTGLYYDIVDSPLRDAGMAELDAFIWPDAADVEQGVFDELREQAKRLYCDTDYVIVASHPVYGVLELGCWMCGFDTFLEKLLLEPEFVDKFFSRYYQYQADISARYYEAIGGYIHVTTSGDDFGTQNGPFLSKGLFDDSIAPWFQKRIALTKSMTKAKYFHHTCGSVYRLMDSLAGCGVDILNPIQPGAFEMEPERLKRDYGEAFTFWGGIDEQNVLTQGTPDDVARHVREVAAVMGQGGRYVIAPSHNIQSDVPPENVVQLYRTAAELDGHPAPSAKRRNSEMGTAGLNR